MITKLSLHQTLHPMLNLVTNWWAQQDDKHMDFSPQHNQIYNFDQCVVMHSPFW